MIDMCDYLIAYVTHPASNSGKFLEYAGRCEKKGLIPVYAGMIVNGGFGFCAEPFIGYA